MSVMAKDALDFALFFSISGVAVLYWHLAGWYLTGYAVTENAIFLRCGRFGEVTYLVPPKSIQSLRVSTLRARATVWFDLPGAEFKLHAIDTRDVSKIKSMVIIEAEKRSPNLF
jgi:sporulation protein YlmC with PRC-barrel domain